MKRHGNLFEKIADMDNLRLAHQKARRRKSWHRAVVRFEQDTEGNLRAIRRSLLDKTFSTAPYTIKEIHEPKRRLIYVLPFAPDRIVQHAIMNILEPLWDGLMIPTSYACRRGMGVQAGSRQVMEYARHYRYCLQGDVSKFYPSMDHAVLSGIVRQKVKCRDTLWLLDDIIHSIPGGTNVPIGNYTSQWFGNLYLNELDQWIKHTHHVRAYVRYCDDFCLFSDDKATLRHLAGEIRTFVADRLMMRLSKLDLFPVDQGVDFLGYRHFSNYILLRKRTAKRVKARLRALPGLLASGRIGFERYRSSIASTMGWIKWANTHNLALAMDLETLWRSTHDAETIQRVCPGGRAA